MVYNLEQKHTICVILYFYNYYVKVFLCFISSLMQINTKFGTNIAVICNIRLDKYLLLAYSVNTPWKAHEERCLLSKGFGKSPEQGKFY